MAAAVDPKHREASPHLAVRKQAKPAVDPGETHWLRKARGRHSPLLAQYARDRRGIVDVVPEQHIVREQVLDDDVQRRVERGRRAVLTIDDGALIIYL